MTEKLILISVPEYEQLLRNSCAATPSVEPSKDIKQTPDSVSVPPPLETENSLQHSASQNLVNKSVHSPPLTESSELSGKKDKKKTIVIKKKREKSSSSKKHTFRIPIGWVSW